MARRAEVQARMEEAEAKLAEEGLWVKETCTGCGASFWTLAERGFLGFRERECPSCHRLMVSPLPWGYRITYWLFFGFLSVLFVKVLAQGAELLSAKVFFFFLLVVALTWAISKDLKIVYRQWSSRRGGGEDQPARNDDDAPSLVFRWWSGFVTLLAGWFMVLLIFGLLEKVVQFFLPDEAGSSNLLLALTWGAYVILGPLLLSVPGENRLELARLASLWLKGFRKLVIGYLIVLPCILLYWASQGMMPFVGIEEGSQEERGLILLVLSMSLLLVPFWVAPLFRWLSGSRLTDQASWFTERMSHVIGHRR